MIIGIYVPTAIIPIAWNVYECMTIPQWHGMDNHGIHDSSFHLSISLDGFPSYEFCESR